LVVAHHDGLQRNIFQVSALGDYCVSGIFRLLFLLEALGGTGKFVNDLSLSFLTVFFLDPLQLLDDVVVKLSGTGEQGLELCDLFDSSTEVINCSEDEDRSMMSEETIKKYLYQFL